MSNLLDNSDFLERLIEEVEETESPKLTNSRLSDPLNSAYRNVASSVALISTLEAKQRKEASLKLVDITETAFRAIEKSLRRDSEVDSSLLKQAKGIIRRIEQFESALSSLSVTSVQESYDIGEDPEALWGHNEFGMPETFTKEEEVNVIEPLAVRILKNNADVPAEAADEVEIEDGEIAPPEGSEASEETVDQTGEDNMISTLATETDKDQENKELPPQFKALEGSADPAKIHENTSHNLKLLDILTRGNI